MLSVRSVSLPPPELWVDDFGDYLYGYALQRVGDTAVAEDLVQETFLAALRAQERFSGKSSAKTWFVAILKNKVVDYFRKRSREPLTVQNDILADEISDFRTGGSLPGSWKAGRRPMDWLIDITDSVERQEFHTFLRNCLDELPARFASVFVLREMEEMESIDICNELGVSSSNLRVLLHRARRRLRRCLERTWLREKGTIS